MRKMSAIEKICRECNSYNFHRLKLIYLKKRSISNKIDDVLYFPVLHLLLTFIINTYTLTYRTIVNYSL